MNENSSEQRRISIDLQRQLERVETELFTLKPLIQEFDLSLKAFIEEIAAAVARASSHD